jgi:hypothetical protein
MPFLGFDPDSVELLARALRRAIDELDGLHLPAMAPLHVRTTRRGGIETLTRWERYTSYLVTTRVHEPALSDGRVRAVSRMLSRLALTVRIDQQVAASNPGNVPSETTERLFIAIVAAIAATQGTADRAAIIDQLVGAGDVHTAAQVLTHLGLEGEHLGAAGSAVVRAWSRADWTVEAGTIRRNPADLVLRAVAPDPVAARAFLSALTDDPHGRHVVLFAPNDPELPERVWSSATRPGSADPGEIGRFVRLLLDDLRSDPLVSDPVLVSANAAPDMHGPVGVDPDTRWLQARAWIGRVVAPWQPYLTGWAPRWGLTPSDGIGALEWVAEDSRAAGALADGFGESIRLAAAFLPTGRPGRIESVEALAWSIGATDDVLVDAAMADEVHERWLAGLVTTAAQQTASSVLSVLPTPAPQVGGLITNHAVNAVGSRLDHGAEGRRKRRRSDSLERRRAGAHALVGALLETHRAKGAVGDQVRMPAATSRAEETDPFAVEPLDRWLRTVDVPEHVRDELVRASGAATGAADRGALSR